MEAKWVEHAICDMRTHRMNIGFIWDTQMPHYVTYENTGKRPEILQTILTILTIILASLSCLIKRSLFVAVFQNGIRTWTVNAEAEHTDLLTTTTGQTKSFLKYFSYFYKLSFWLTKKESCHLNGTIICHFWNLWWTLNGFFQQETPSTTSCHLSSTLFYSILGAKTFWRYDTKTIFLNKQFVL